MLALSESEESFFLSCSQMAHMVDGFLPSRVRVMVVRNNAFKFSLEYLVTKGVLLSTVMEIEFEFLNKLIESEFV